MYGTTYKAKRNEKCKAKILKRAPKTRICGEITVTNSDNKNLGWFPDTTG
jgi:hypothetical protein